MKAIIFSSRRDEYSAKEVRCPMTVKELRAYLEDLDDDMAVIVSHDGGYTYGTLSYDSEIDGEEDDE